MKKKVFVIFFSLLILSAFFISAETNQSVDDKGYSCLLNKVTNCASLSTEEKTFSLLAIGKCKTELLADSSGNQCWPQSGCTIKATAQAILALSQTGSDTSQAEKWLSSKNMTYNNIDWLLQIDTTNSTSCTATYLGGTYSFSTNEDKTLSGSAGSCLSLYQNYWLKISPNCYSQDIQISCSDSFMTSLLYKKKTSDTIYVSDKTVSAAGEGTTTEKVNSLCFSSGTSCDYEGTLWAALVLKSRGKDISAYIPYLIALADDNPKYVPYSFIYSLTGNFRTDLLAQQQQNQWWSASGDKLYDTAVALLPFQNENALLEKTNSQNWLAQIQGTDGCWQDNIRNTAFILYSLWPRQVSKQISPDCQNSGNYCTSSALCSSVSGNLLGNYSGCFGTNICCDKQPPTPTCAEQNGKICSSDQTCIGGTTVSSSDTTSLTSCCINGDCGTPSPGSECELNNGVCKSSCSSNEQFSSFSCSSGVCCIAKSSTTTSNTLVIVILVILIILAVLGIIFRNKLKMLWLKFTSKGKGKPSPSVGGPRFPPTSSQKIYPGAVPRKIIPPQQPQRMPERPVARNKPEYDEVLKKLKEMGK